MKAKRKGVAATALHHIHDSIQMSRRLNNGRPNDRPRKKYSTKIFFNYLQMNFRKGNYITTNLIENS